MKVRVIPPGGDPKQESLYWSMDLTDDRVILLDANRNEIGSWDWNQALLRFKPANFWRCTKDTLFDHSAEQPLKIDRRDYDSVWVALEVIRLRLDPTRSWRILRRSIALTVLGLILVLTGIAMELTGQAAEHGKVLTFGRNAFILGLCFVVSGFAQVNIHRMVKRTADQPKSSAETES
ncbi:hypothetical protein [Zavarzinella formosa]|uniref:hypothetical protein n=1 Tax=Zavarzinella formosa TaxID=360055 RepID=UPI00037D8C02|nr:hypothetical protein [Zavarzinella formosa]